MIQDLVSFRYTLRKFLRAGDDAPREYGVTPRQYQLMLGVAGFTGTGHATVSELAEFLQEKHNSVVGLVDRAGHSGFVRRASGSGDRRLVLVSLTSRGEKTLARLSQLDGEAVMRLREELLNRESIRKPRHPH